jgi:hypothetical protein
MSYNASSVKLYNATSSIARFENKNKNVKNAKNHYITIVTIFSPIQAKAEQEEEFISNTLLKKIQELKKEKENLALNYEQEEECLTNDLSRKLDQVSSFEFFVRLPPKYYGQLCMGHFWAELFYTIALLIN